MPILSTIAHQPYLSLHATVRTTSRRLGDAVPFDEEPRTRTAAVST
jgi:hypothetical protein